ncbi:Uncharacterised protein [Weissella viridescens]|uniref:Uncharacterized protein n=1 Tax=Weissella viridescens TaxID=1629 RepID=A0A380P8U8_WEIVI|nr:Uncharacterised protein [Weissella viridescens]
MKDLPDDQRKLMEQRIADQRKVLDMNTPDKRQSLHKLKQKQRDRWAAATKEIQNVTEPAVEADIRSLEQSGKIPA